jgi:riboflavin kinase
MASVKLIGEAISGKGDGRKYIQLPWVVQQIKEKIGFIPYPGTLNLKLNESSVKEKSRLEDKSSERICPAKGYCWGLLFKAKTNDVECGLVIPQIEHYPKDLIEIISPINLRDKLKIQNGNILRVIVYY